MLLILRLYTRFWKRRHRSPRLVESRPGHTLSDGSDAGPAASHSRRPRCRYRVVHFAERNVMERRKRSLGLDARELDHLRPFVDFSAMNLANSSGEFDATATAPRSANQDAIAVDIPKAALDALERL